MVVGYPRRGRFVVRAGPLIARLGAAADAGPVSANFRTASVALGADGTAAAVWESTTYSLPWRLRAAVRPAGRARFARYAELGAAQARPGTLLMGPAPVAALGTRGAVTVGFSDPDANRALCATATPAGRFAAPQPVASAISGIHSEIPTLVFGPAGAAAAVSSALTPDESTILSTLVGVGSGCRVAATTAIDPAGGPLVAVSLDGARPNLGARSAHAVGQLAGAVAADDRRPGPVAATRRASATATARRAALRARRAARRSRRAPAPACRARAR